MREASEPARATASAMNGHSRAHTARTRSRDEGVGVLKRNRRVAGAVGARVAILPHSLEPCQQVRLRTLIERAKPRLHLLRWLGAGRHSGPHGLLCLLPLLSLLLLQL